MWLKINLSLLGVPGDWTHGFSHRRLRLYHLVTPSPASSSSLHSPSTLLARVYRRQRWVPAETWEGRSLPSIPPWKKKCFSNEVEYYYANHLVMVPSEIGEKNKVLYKKHLNGLASIIDCPSPIKYSLVMCVWQRVWHASLTLQLAINLPEFIRREAWSLLRLNTLFILPINKCLQVVNPVQGTEHTVWLVE